MPDLHTTNVLLGIMAAVSVLQGLLLIGVGVAGFVMYRRAMLLVADLEARQIAPLREKVDSILTDVQSITARVRAGVYDKVSQAAGVVRGLRAVIISMLHRRGSHA